MCSLLDELLEEFEAGRFVLDERFEDGHSAIELYLTERAGPVGAKVHTVRSRNDQVAVATRLYIKDRLAQLAESCGRIAGACLDRAVKAPDLPMPGYTHLQRAVPSSTGLWLAAFAEAFTDNLAFTSQVSALIDCSPLGTAAGYGVNLPLDREAPLGSGVEVSSPLVFPRVPMAPAMTSTLTVQVAPAASVSVEEKFGP